MAGNPQSSAVAQVSLRSEGCTAYLQIERPDALNAISGDVLRGLQEHVETIRARRDLLVVVVSGAGEKAFVAGADIKQMQSLTAREAEEFSCFGSEVFARLESLPQIVVARVQGFALGGGLELALAADFIIASDRARFGLPEVSLGLIPGFGGTQRLARRIGAARAIEWLASADKYTAEEALRAGLVNQVVPAEELVAKVDALAARIARNGPHAVKVAKSVARAGLDSPLDAGLRLESTAFGLAFASPEAREGMTAFVEKRPAQFQKS